MASETVLFEERQRAAPWVWGAATVPVGLGGYGIYQQIYKGRPFGTNPLSDTALMIVTAAMAGLAVAAYRATLVTRVYPGELQVRLPPILNKRIPLEQIVRWEVRDYSPIREYGGWGIRWSWAGKGWAYNMRGDRGVQLELAGGRRLLIGSQRPEELAAALERAAAAV